VSILAALAFVLAPVRQPQVTYHWTPAPGPVTPVALPLLPYQPARLTASFGCDTLRRLGRSGVLLSTVPLTADPSAPELPGLRVAVVAGQLVITSRRTQIAVIAVPDADGCSFTLQSDSQRTRLLHDGSLIATVTGDVWPAVAGLFTEAPDPVGLDVALMTDTRFQTTPTSLKQGLAWLCLAALLGMLLALWRADRLHAGVRMGAPAVGSCGRPQQ
jgi:arabinosyltransferase A/arabinosyltransferase B/arabinosyltransferase C